MLSRSPVASRTRSYEAYLRWVKQPFIAEASQGRRPPPAGRERGRPLPRGGGYWIEAYPTEGTLAEDVDDLLADLFDPASKGDDPAAAPRDVDVDVDTWLADLRSAPLRPLDRIPGTTGEAWASPAAPVDRTTSWARRSDRRRAGPPRRSARRRRGSASNDRRADASGLERRAEATAGADGSGERGVGEPRPPSGLVARGGRAADPIKLQRRQRPAGAAPRRSRDHARRLRPRPRSRCRRSRRRANASRGTASSGVLDRNISWVDVRIGGEGYAVTRVARSLRPRALSNDSGVWLRHMAAICVRLDDDTVGLRMIDLKTDLPFFLEEDTPRWSVVASGPFAMRLGRHVVCGFPIGPLTGDEPVAPQRHVERRDLDPAATGIIETGLIRLPSEGNVVPVRAPNEITSFLPSMPVAQIQDLAGGGSSPTHIRVTLERGGWAPRSSCPPRRSTRASSSAGPSTASTAACAASSARPSRGPTSSSSAITATSSPTTCARPTGHGSPGRRSAAIE